LPVTTKDSVFERPFVLDRYVGSHSHVVLRSGEGDDIVYVLGLAVHAMHLHASYERLEISPATGPERDAINDFARIPEPWATRMHYVRVGDGVRSGFVACFRLSVLHNGHPYASPAFAYRPTREVDTGARLPLRFAIRFSVRMCSPGDHDLVLNSYGNGVDLVFRDVEEFRLVTHWGPLTVDRTGPRRFVLSDGEHEGYVVAAAFELRRPPR
jgi:hypothetical protein